MFKIEMLDDEGAVTGIFDAITMVGFCEDCERTERLVTWTTDRGIEHFVCGPCLAQDDFARLTADSDAIEPWNGGRS